MKLPSKATATTTNGDSPSSGDRRKWLRQLVVPAGVSGLLVWLAFPPVNLWPLAWLAPVGWIWLIATPRLLGKHPYRTVYIIGLLHWLLVIHWIRLPHWSASFGWLVLSMYLGCYLPLFVVLARTAAHRLRVPVVIAAPMVWTGLEVSRGYLFTGFSIALLGHTQVSWLSLIQVADLGGAYAVSFLIVFVAACLTMAWSAIWSGRHRRSAVYVGYGVTVIGVALVYGWLRVSQPIDDTTDPVNVALIQGSIDTQFDLPPEEYVDTFPQHMELSRQAVQDNSALHLIVWPESTYTGGFPRFTVEAGFIKSDELGFTAEDVRMGIDNEARKNEWMSVVLGTPLLVGCEALHFGVSSVERFNSALFIDESGEVTGRYDKMHPVMFGEYVPLGRVFPWLYRLTPMPGGLTPGKSPAVFEVQGLKLSPSICFENTVPHLIRNQVVKLSNEGKEPDVLVTVTNDGWFWGSSLLDMHLTCGVFRAIECRKPMLIAANTRFSAWIDGNGQLLARGPRREPAVVPVAIRKDGRRSMYLLWGDAFAFSCAAVCVLAGILGILRGTRRPTAVLDQDSGDR